MKILVTGGAGFIGSNFVHHMLKHKDCDITVLDKLTYAGRLENLQDIASKIKFIKGDICDKRIADDAVTGKDVIFNFAAETHVDRSIIESGVFVNTDIIGTHTLLEAARKHDVKKFVQISTDEVYGSIDSGSFKEDAALNPSSPYSASKAGADMLVAAYFKTYGLPVLTTRSSNNYGPFQFPEKLIPVLTINAMHGKQLPIYAKGANVRDWLYVMDNCEAIDAVSQNGKPGEIYNVSSGVEKKNIEVAMMILKELGKPTSLINFVKDRPGHDFRYSLDNSKIRRLGWKANTNFADGLKRTIKWYSENEWWWKPLVV